MAPSLYMSFFVPFCWALIKQFEYRVSSPDIARYIERHFCHTCAPKAVAGHLRPWREMRSQTSTTGRGTIRCRTPMPANPASTHRCSPAPFVRVPPLPKRLRAREIARDETSSGHGGSHTCPSAPPLKSELGPPAFHHTAFSAFAVRPLRNTRTHAYPRDRGETCR